MAINKVLKKNLTTKTSGVNKVDGLSEDVRNRAATNGITNPDATTSSGVGKSVSDLYTQPVENKVNTNGIKKENSLGNTQLNKLYDLGGNEGSGENALIKPKTELKTENGQNVKVNDDGTTEDASPYTLDTPYGQTQEYKNLVDQNTSALNKLYNAQQQALKYADTTANAMGVGSQGAGLQQQSAISNMYANAMANQNADFNNYVANRDTEYQAEYDAKVEQDSQTAYDNIQNAISSLITYDSNDKADYSGVTADKIEEIINVYGAKLTDEQRKQLEYKKQELLNAIDEANTPNSDVNASSTDAGYTNEVTLNDSKASINFEQGSGLNKNITYTLADGTTLKMEMSNKLNLSNSEYSSMPVGQPFIVKDKDNSYCIAIKDQDGNYRRVEKRGSNTSDVVALAKEIGFTSGYIKVGNSKTINVATGKTPTEEVTDNVNFGVYIAR